MLIVELGQRLDVPPALVILGIPEVEISPIRALRILEGAHGLAIYALPIHPAREGTAVVEHAVQYDAHAPPVDLLAEAREPGVAGLQVDPICGAVPVACRAGIVGVARRQHFPFVPGNHSQMRIDIIVILRIVLMRRRRDEYGVEINDLHAKGLKIIQLLPYTHKVATIVASIVVRFGHGVP